MMKIITDGADIITHDLDTGHFRHAHNHSPFAFKFTNGGHASTAAASPSASKTHGHGAHRSAYSTHAASHVEYDAVDDQNNSEVLIKAITGLIGCLTLAFGASKVFGSSPSKPTTETKSKSSYKSKEVDGSSTPATYATKRSGGYSSVLLANAVNGGSESHK
ncbi:unnamed protein product [Ambrosiozyma monospora]|uniref:Unnamed protein product n=1 Tax=Ambrosiozyma monospora TaxID=43982 RepID=A0ACB5UBZ8_AMBMO|nr:unnamed protein product [Ambrosiozyma monospora]